MNDIVTIINPYIARQPESTTYATKELLQKCQTVEDVKDVLEMSFQIKQVKPKTIRRWKRQAKAKINE